MRFRGCLGAFVTTRWARRDALLDASSDLCGSSAHPQTHTPGGSRGHTPTSVSLHTWRCVLTDVVFISVFSDAFLISLLCANVSDSMGRMFAVGRLLAGVSLAASPQSAQRSGNAWCMITLLFGHARRGPTRELVVRTLVSQCAFKVDSYVLFV